MDEAEKLGNLYEFNGYKIYTPEDDECVVVFEDPFGEKRTMDVDDFTKLIQSILSIHNY